MEVAADGAGAVTKARTAIPDLIVLDLTLPDYDGFELLPILRSLGQVPIIVLTARVQRDEKLKGLALGADDYITKPFDPAEFLARIRAVLRRGTAGRRAGSDWDRSPLTSSRSTHRAAGRAIPLTHREFELLSYLADRRDVVVPSARVAPRGVGISRQRHRHANRRFRHRPSSAKDREDPHHPQFIRTAHGDGYCLSGVSDDELPPSGRPPGKDARPARNTAVRRATTTAQSATNFCGRAALYCCLRTLARRPRVDRAGTEDSMRRRRMTAWHWLF